MIRKAFLPVIIFSLVTASHAATVDTISIYSNAMHKEFKCVVIKPELNKKHAGRGGKNIEFPVVYLLHGYDGWYSNWIIRVPQLKEYADQYKLMIVCPDGGKSSWYFDSPVDSTMKYETYISNEVPAYIDAHYPTIKNRAGRGITGLSMGGHGAFLLALRHPDFFGACGSMSGGMDLNYSRNKFDIMKRLGDTLTHAENWQKNVVIHVVDEYKKRLQTSLADTLTMIFDCGVDDFYFESNKLFHEKLLQLKLAHDYIVRPGKHDWAYWRNAVPYQLLFFSNFFKGSNK
ncbi:MAG: esterase family protein [Chitinophagaceae bacterium]|nr:esterase family protein [Chitinophagaceae bacterium]